MDDPTFPPNAFSDPDPVAPQPVAPPAEEFDWVTPPTPEPSVTLPPEALPLEKARASENEVGHVLAETHAFDQSRAYEEGRAAGGGFEQGTTDARYEAVGVNRRLVIGAALGFVALVLLALMLVTGDDGDERAVVDGPIREAAEPEFIDRAPPAPAFASPEPFSYQEPDYQAPPPGGGAALADPYAPPAYSDQGPYADPAGYAPNDPYAGNPYASAPQQQTPRAAPPVDPRRERYLKARGSTLMVDGSAGALSVGGRTAAASAAGSSAGAFAVRPRTPGALDQAADAAVGRTPDQQAAYDALDPETRAVVDDTVLLMRAIGASGQTAPGAAPGAPPAAAPAPGASPGWRTSPGPAASVPRAPQGQASEPGPATRAEFLRRVQSGTVTEPYRVEMPKSPDARARYSPLVRRSTDRRGPSADDALPMLSAPAVDGRAGISAALSLPSLSLLPGTVIPAVLLNAINSELPGDVVAQVERDVYDSASLRYVLIPKGTRLVGAYDDQVAYGQNRALVAWTTMVFPDGRVVSLPGLPGVDLQGAAGLQDRTDRHLDRVFGAAVALAAVGTGLALATPQTDGLDLSPQTVASAQVAIELSRVATELLRRELDVQPTITIRPGYRLLVFLAREMQFDGPYTPAPDVGRFRRHVPSLR